MDFVMLGGAISVSLVSALLGYYSYQVVKDNNKFKKIPGPISYG